MHVIYQRLSWLNRKSATALASLLLSVSPRFFNSRNMAHQMGIVSFIFILGLFICLANAIYIVDSLALFLSRRLFSIFLFRYAMVVVREALWGGN